ncbi:E3 ubiquitin-protein ligase ZNF598-like isoform X3 [Musca autumnalis]|uniref:E3 ubiquitin-protein ligase ZNF598-like isoform X3 n=1 Tax=Musca autumnalis TaxID=221902 RepID=UPI003CE9CA0A
MRLPAAGRNSTVWVNSVREPAAVGHLVICTGQDDIHFVWLLLITYLRICRQVLSKVIFTYDKLPYRELEAKNRSEYYSKKYKICFYTSEIQQKFFELLDHPCPKCDCPPYRTFQGLRNHVRKEHDHFYCDLCVENLKIFTFERRSYTQAELGSDQR